MSYAEFRANIQSHIDTVGQSLVGVFSNPPFTYSIGMANWGLPELLVIGFADNHGGAMLNFLCDELRKRGRAFDEGEHVSLGGNFPVKIVTSQPYVRDLYTIQAGQFLGREDYPVQQVLLCDLLGRFPGDPHCDAPYGLVPDTSQEPTLWISHMEDRDDFGDEIEDEVLDAATSAGPWALMTPASWKAHRKNPMLGTGYGQRYRKSTTDLWVKVEG